VLRRQHGKSDVIDAKAAARAALAQPTAQIPKSQNGTVELLRVLRLQRRSAMIARTQAGNQFHAVVSSAPDRLRQRYRDRSLPVLIAALRRKRKTTSVPVEDTTHDVLRALSRRWSQLHAEIRAVDR